MTVVPQKRQLSETIACHRQVTSDFTSFNLKP